MVPGAGYYSKRSAEPGYVYYSNHGLNGYGQHLIIIMDMDMLMDIVMDMDTVMVMEMDMRLVIIMDMEIMGTIKDYFVLVIFFVAL